MISQKKDWAARISRFSTLCSSKGKPVAVVKRNTKVLSLILLDRSHLHKNYVSLSHHFCYYVSKLTPILPTCACCKLADTMNMVSEYQIDDVLLGNDIGRVYVFYFCMATRGLNCYYSKIFG